MTSETDPSDPKASELADRPSSMAASAFLGIAWFICIELNIRLLYRATRRSLYFWSCLLCSWGLIVHGISIILANFNKWTSYSAIVFIYLSWLVFVVAQSFVLYSRLGLVWRNTKKDRWILYMITTNSVVFGLTTVTLGMIAARLSSQAPANLIWDKVQVAAFFIQECIIGMLYIWQTSKYFQSLELLGNCRRTTRDNLRNLIAVNVLIIILDASVLGLAYSDRFFLQGFYKVAVYAVKLRTEFTILNQLRQALAGGSTGASGFAVQTDQRPIVMAPLKSNDVVEVVA
ncbi:hypothetical protein J4E93_003101 [Alternaria ventricosa]|uniref:uncharacterized protein n=1 Tax=Alternaria ventricosa TaxID=1187951 RepID=UPI0020C53954|nr:uncharacterized protein J4E93_003101 [Alternaria ventricosa]KAI4650744.1 hypothetical protein J4E93_003101 [Alternaria ventricosa]